MNKSASEILTSFILNTDILQIQTEAERRVLDNQFVEIFITARFSFTRPICLLT